MGRVERSLGTRGDEIITFPFLFPLKNIPFTYFEDVLYLPSPPPPPPPPHTHTFDYPTIESDVPRNRTRLSFSLTG